MADLPPVADEVHMQRVDPLRWCNLRKDLVCLIGSDLGSNQSQAARYSPDMCINWHDRQPQIKHQYASGRLGTHPRQAAQVVPGIFRRATGKLVVEVGGKGPVLS